jgi:hypothetical protein
VLLWLTHSSLSLFYIWSRIRLRRRVTCYSGRENMFIFILDVYMSELIFSSHLQTPPGGNQFLFCRHQSTEQHLFLSETVNKSPEQKKNRPYFVSRISHTRNRKLFCRYMFFLCFIFIIRLLLFSLSVILLLIWHTMFSTCPHC